MELTTKVSRILLGLAFLVFGANGFFDFMPAPPMPDQAGQFLGLMVGTGYLSVVKVLEVASGVLLLTGRSTPLALMLLGPVLVNILLFHVFMAPAGLPVPLVLAVLFTITLWPYKDKFIDLLKTQ